MSKVNLTDRVLYSDGDSVVPASKIMSLLSSGAKIDGLCVDIVTPAIAQFNKFVPKNEQIKIKTETRPNNISWTLPQKYAEMDVLSYVVTTFYSLPETVGKKHISPWFDKRRSRVIQELAMYEDMNLLPVLRVLIYIINTLREKNIVWGVGRGSSVSSYVLYILGVHDVDSVEYDLDIHDFLRI